MKPTVCDRAVSLLANREHSAYELSRKLITAGYKPEEIAATVEKLQQANLQSDKRFAESFIRSRANKGYGEVRIKNELKQRGITSELITDCLQNADIDWFTVAARVRCKRFCESVPDDFKSRAQQQRFLHYRGFTQEQITESFNQP